MVEVVLAGIAEPCVEPALAAVPADDADVAGACPALEVCDKGAVVVVVTGSVT